MTMQDDKFAALAEMKQRAAEVAKAAYDRPIRLRRVSPSEIRALLETVDVPSEKGGSSS